ncbi:hypothetical protein [Streptomyces sp. SM11]|uniref:hypothetical protein n=1 Tax=Streptomyces sp. SM11 TaxID=565557 RepID=UPI000CD4B2B2|nr:hypothetical protein [Streptomyces sp. SM11]
MSSTREREGTAIAFPATAGALARYRRRAGVWCVVGGAVLAAGAALIVLAESAVGWTDWLRAVMTPLFGTGLGALCVGLGLAFNARRMRRRLSDGPWTPCAARSKDPGRSGAPRVVLRDPRTGDLVCLGAVVSQFTVHLTETGWDGILWWCGDPVRGGVVSRPGGEGLFWARPVTGFRRRRLVAWARETGIGGRADPVPLLEPEAPGATPKEPAGSCPAAPAPLPAVPRRRPFWRWVLLVGCAVLGLGIAASEAAMDDPKAELTVVSEAADGDCTVRWADPWSGERREGPFRCDPDRAPVLKNQELGWVVSYGPWKGDLYNAEWDGTPANDVNDLMFLAGVLLTLVSLTGGAVRVVRRKRDRRSLAHRPAHAAPVAPAPRVSLVKGAPGEQPPDLSYAVVAEAAERRAPEPLEPLPPLPPGSRERPWWRSRSLLALSGVLGALYCLALMLAAIALMWWMDGPVPLLASALAAFNTVRLGYLAVRHGIPNARTLARAGRRPEPVRKRYALLRGHVEGAAVLIFFPLDGGPGALAESSLEIIPPGSSRKPWRGLPAPTGVVELYGDIDGAPAPDDVARAIPDDDERPIVVPWIDGRPLWPLHGYDAVRPEDVRDRDYFARLLS